MVFCMRSLGIAGRFDCVSVGRTPQEGQNNVVREPAGSSLPGTWNVACRCVCLNSPAKVWRNFATVLASHWTSLAAENRFGVLGHSAGGTLALAAAVADSRISACYSNGGTPELKQGLLKSPRVLQRFGRILGNSASEADVLGFLDQLDLATAASRMQASLLCLQGGQDPIVMETRRGAWWQCEAPKQGLWHPERRACIASTTMQLSVIASSLTGSQCTPTLQTSAVAREQAYRCQWEWRGSPLRAITLRCKVAGSRQPPVESCPTSCR